MNAVRAANVEAPVGGTAGLSGTSTTGCRRRRSCKRSSTAGGSTGVEGFFTYTWNCCGDPQTLANHPELLGHVEERERDDDRPAPQGPRLSRRRRLFGKGCPGRATRGRIARSRRLRSPTIHLRPLQLTVAALASQPPTAALPARRSPRPERIIELPETRIDDLAVALAAATNGAAPTELARKRAATSDSLARIARSRPENTAICGLGPIRGRRL